MTTSEKQIELVCYRLRQAEESLDEAELLFNERKSPRSVINRVYYSMFYSVLAIMVFEKYLSSKHSGILSYFNTNFVKNGFFSKELGKYLNKAFELRIRGDYREQVELTYEQVEPFLNGAKTFLEKVKDYLKDKHNI